MKLKTFFISAVAFLGLLLAACNNDTEYIGGEGSSDAQIKSFSAKATPYSSVDSIPYLVLEKTSFSILNRGQRLIFNADSLPVHTEIRKLAVTLEYTVAPAKVELIYHNEDPVEWNGTDSVEFKKEGEEYYPLFRTTAYDGKTTRDYSIEFRIHKQDPDSIRWINMEDFELPEPGESKVLEDNANGQFHAFIKVGNTIKYYTSPIENPAWGASSDTNLPSNTLVKSIYKAGNIFAAIDEDGKIYSANVASGASWTAGSLTNVTAIVGLLPEINSEDARNELLFIYKDAADDVLKYGKTADFNNWEEVVEAASSTVSSRFPVENFTTLTQTIGNESALVVSGGSNQQGDVVKLSWRISNRSLGDETNKAKISVIAAAGTANILPDNDNIVSFLYNKNSIYAMSTDSLALYRSHIGDNWQLTDKKQKLHKDMENMRYPSVVVDNIDQIWVFGGVSKEGVYSQQIWRGRLNKLAYK